VSYPNDLIFSSLAQSVVSVLFRVHTSQIEFSLLEWIEIGEGRLNEICCEPHFGGLPGDRD
jgi:hypothetical protein